MFEGWTEYRETETAHIKHTLLIDGALRIDGQQPLQLQVSWDADGGMVIMRAAEGKAWLEISGQDVLCLLNFLLDEGLA